MFAALMISASLLAADPIPAERLTVADVVKGLGLDEAKFSYDDEPPGKLWAVKCPTTMNKVTVRVRIELVSKIFSDKLDWDIKAVRAATVHKVVIELEPPPPLKGEPEFPPLAPKTEAKLPPSSKGK